MPQTLEAITIDQLQAKQFSEDVRLASFGKFGNSLTLAKGTVLAKKTSDGKLYAYAEPSHTQLITISGTPTGGTFLLTFNGQTTTALAFNAAAATVQTALQALTSIGASNATVAGSAGGPYTVTFAAALANAAQPLIQIDVGGLTGGTPAGTVADNTTLTGLETAVGILPVPVATDGSGNIYLGDSNVANSLNPAVKTVPVIIGGGVWDSTDFTGWDAGALADLGARTLFNGLVRIP